MRRGLKSRDEKQVKLMSKKVERAKSGAEAAAEAEAEAIAAAPGEERPGPAEPPAEPPARPETGGEAGAQAEAEAITAANGLAAWEREKEALMREKEELINLLQRERAGFDNYRRISRAEQDEAREYGLFNFLGRLLPVLDNLERALQSARGENVPASYIEGLEIINRQLLQLLEQEGASPLAALGQPFDPHYHHAVMQTNEGEAAPGTVVEELQKGYLYKKKVLRPALVKVFQD